MKINYKAIQEDRVIYNNKLLQILNNLIKQYPELRLGQILYGFGFITKKEGTIQKLFDPFNEEPTITYNRVIEYLREINIYDKIVEQ